MYRCAYVCVTWASGASQWPPGITSLLPSLEDCYWVTNETQTWRKPEWPWETWRVPWWISVPSGAEGNGVKTGKRAHVSSTLASPPGEGGRHMGEVPVTAPNLGEQGRAGQVGVQCRGHVKGRSLQDTRAWWPCQEKQTNRPGLSLSNTQKAKQKPVAASKVPEECLPPWSTQLPTS